MQLSPKFEEALVSYPAAMKTARCEYASSPVGASAGGAAWSEKLLRADWRNTGAFAKGARRDLSTPRSLPSAREASRTRFARDDALLRVVQARYLRVAETLALPYERQTRCLGDLFTLLCTLATRRICLPTA